MCFAPLEAADVFAPSAPADLAATATGNQVTLTWTASTDDWYVAGYRIFRDGQPLNSTPLANVGGTVLTYTDAVVPPGPHTYTVAAFDSASPRGLGLSIVDQLFAGFGLPYGNLSAESLPVSVGQADVTTPSVPVNLVATTGSDSATLTWSASTDDVGVASYTVYRDGTEVGTVGGSTLTYTDSGLAVGTYTYTVDAVDGATPTPNRSAQSAPATAIVTGVADATDPTAPTGVAAATSPDIHGRERGRELDGGDRRRRRHRLRRVPRRRC